MENFLNRRMFATPIRAAEGVYVPTIEDILQFYQGEFDANGQPINQEALAQAAELATIIGTPANKDNSQFILDDAMAEKYKALGANVIPDGVGGQKFGDTFPNMTNAPSLNELYSGANTEEEKINLANISTDGVKIDDGLTVFNADNLSPEMQTNLDALNQKEAATLKMQEETNNLNNQRQLELNSANAPATVARDLTTEDEYAQRQLDIANQKELFEGLQKSGIKNLAGDTTQPITGDANIELIKRNILRGTNIVEQDKDDPIYGNLSAVDRMKIDDAISDKKKEDLDLTYSGEDGIRNFIDAAGSSAEAAIMIWNDISNATGRIAEGADELLEGWKKAFSKGFSDEQKENLDKQLDYLKSKNEDGEKDLGVGAPVFGVDMETLKKGGENIKEWYKDTIFPEVFTNVQNLFGAKELGDGTLSADQQTGTVAATVDPRKQSGLSEEQDKEIDLADRPPSIVEDVSFKTKVDETKNKVIETVEEIKETVIEKFPEIKDKVTEKIEVLKEKLKNGDITKESFFEKINEIRDVTIDKVTDLNSGDKVTAIEFLTDLFEDVKKSTTDLFTKKEVPNELDNITAGVSEGGDKKIDVAGRADVETPIKKEEVAEIDKTITDNKEVVTNNNEGAGTVAANESAGTGSGSSAFTTTTGSGTSSGDLNVQNMIAETAKQTGYNFKGLDDSKDDLALKTMMYGIELFMTPGKFSEAVGSVAKKALTNEINQRYKTKAAQSKFRGELFKTILAGKMDIAKEMAKLSGKKPDYSSGYSFPKGSVDRSVGSWIKNNMGMDIQIDYPDGIPKDPKGIVAYNFVQEFKNQVQEIADVRKAEGGKPSLNEELLQEAYNNISGDYKANKAELNAVNKIWNYVTGKSEEEIEQQKIEGGSLTIDRRKSQSKDIPTTGVMTDAMIATVMKDNKQITSKAQAIEILKQTEELKNWDFSQVE